MLRQMEFVESAGGGIPLFLLTIELQNSTLNRLAASRVTNHEIEFAGQVGGKAPFLLAI